MTLSEKKAILDYAEREIQHRTREFQRVSTKDGDALLRCAGKIKEAEKVSRDLRMLLRKL